MKNIKKKSITGKLNKKSRSDHVPNRLKKNLIQWKNEKKLG